jgi:hypothetical protein
MAKRTVNQGFDASGPCKAGSVPCFTAAWLNGSGDEADSGQGVSRSAPSAKAGVAGNAADHSRRLGIADPVKVPSVGDE